MSDTPQILLNNSVVNVDVPNSIPLLDFIRYHQGLKGTKIGCREGDCGACVVLVGEIKDNNVEYQTLTSCLTPMTNVVGKHVVTIEGLNLKNELNRVQQVLLDFGGTQCGACTPGFVVSIIAGILNNSDSLISSIDGNICRCTGYKSIEKAITAIQEETVISNTDNLIENLIEAQIIPEYFKSITDKILSLNRTTLESYNSRMRVISGGTDLFVQIPDSLIEENLYSVFKNNDLISETTDYISIGGSCTASQIMNSEIIQQFIPLIGDHFRLIASTPIRNIATIAGNIVNGSPIADMVIYFLPFQPTITLKDLDTSKTREIELSDIYLKYKTLNKQPSEIIEKLQLTKPSNQFRFNFEKVSKRRILDIATVNTAMYIEIDENRIVTKLQISAGGVYEIPKLLTSTQTMIGKSVSESEIKHLLSVINQEIAPISDVRGSDLYKRKLLRNLVLSHFLECFSDSLSFEELVA